LERIALEFELTVDELCERFADAIEHGPARVNARLTEALYRTTMRGNVTAIRLYLQTQEKGYL